MRIHSPKEAIERGIGMGSNTRRSRGATEEDELLDEVERGETTIVLTRNGVPIARVVPFASPAPLTGSVEFLVDDDQLLEPVDVGWEAAG